MRTAWIALVVLALAGGCKKDEAQQVRPEVGKPKPVAADAALAAPPDAAPPPPGLEAGTITIKMAAGEGTMQLAIRLPAGWPRSETSRGIRFDDPRQLGDAAGGIEADCDGVCDAKKIPATVDKLVAGYAARWTTPNSGTGKKELDDVRLAVKVTETGDLPQGGKFVFADVNIPRDAKLEGPYRSEHVGACFHYRKDDDQYVETSFRVDAEWKDVAVWLALLQEACKATTRQ